eukprot:1178405-Heterocapsa_arctica.AAC.1
MRNKIKTERTKRWRAWADKSWDTKKKDIYRWIKEKKGQGPLILLPEGSAQMSNRLKVAEKAWGGLWVVDAEDLPEFDDEKCNLSLRMQSEEW